MQLVNAADLPPTHPTLSHNPGLQAHCLLVMYLAEGTAYILSGTKIMVRQKRPERKTYRIKLHPYGDLLFGYAKDQTYIGLFITFMPWNEPKSNQPVVQ